MRIALTFFLLLVALPGVSNAAICNAVTGSETGLHNQGLHEAEATPFQFQFESGASWEMCWHIDEQAGLVLSRVYYGGPTERPRQVLDAASIGQILFKYDEDTDASHLLSQTGLGGSQFNSASVDDCINGELLAGVDGVQLCQRTRNVNHLTQARRTQALRRHEISLHARSVIGTHQFEQVWRFSEDGEITPTVLFSGSINRYTNDARYGVKIDSEDHYASSAVMLVNWRLDFNIDGTADNDRVDEIEFNPYETDKRKISITPLDREAARKTNAVDFRGWRISDAEVSSGESSGTSATTRVGYYLDPQSAGFRYVSNDTPWTMFDFYVTEQSDCERLSSFNNSVANGCDASLTEFVNDAPLGNADIVTWFSVSRHFAPQLHDTPAISTREISFKLVPFDWSQRSPFALLIEPDTDSTITGAQ